MRDGNGFPDVLREPDGPMLKHCPLPRDPAPRPNREFVEERESSIDARRRSALW